MADEKVSIHVRVSPEIAAKIDELSKRMNASHSKMASWLLEAGLEDNEFMIKLVTAKYIKPLTKGLAELGRRKGKPATS